MLTFFAGVLVTLVVIRILAPTVYSDALNTPFARSPWLLNWSMAGVIGFVVLVSAGVIARWRWMFWLLVIAFVSGILRLPVLMLEVSGIVRSTSPEWYVALQGAIGVIQFGIGVALIKGYRRAGPWGSF